MESFFRHLREAAGMGAGFYWYLGAVIAVSVLLAIFRPVEKRRTALAIALLGPSLLSLLVAALLASAEVPTSSGLYRLAIFVYLCLLVLTSVQLGGSILFGVVLRRLGAEPPAILRDLLLLGVYVVLLLAILAKVNVNVAGIVTTSAVLTAVIGFALQDTLGNVIGGLVLQMDRSIQAGDWVRVDGREGVVREVRWRQTSIEMADWSTVIIPNSQLMKSAVTVLGRREGRPRRAQRKIVFNVDYRHAPSEVTAAINSAGVGEGVRGVAAEPQPACNMVAYEQSYGQYAFVYWVNEWDADENSLRARIFMALRRSGMSCAIPALANFATIDDESRRQRRAERDLEQRVGAVAGVGLFAPLHEDERRVVAAALTTVPFASGEIITRQGAVAHWLYILYKGSAEVRVASEAGGPTHILATLGEGSFFGEMGLLTGEPRTATVAAMGDCWCYRLDKEAFLGILQKRPELAAEISRILATRKAELEAAREGLDQAAARKRVKAVQADMVDRILSFFKLR